MSYENIQVESAGGVVTITVNRPPALNALNGAVLRELKTAIDGVARDAAVRAVIVTGSGEKAFVAGADIAEMAQLTSQEGEAFGRLGHAVMSGLEALPIPTIAAVNGFALGGGCELALACDLLYASEKARFGFPEVGLAVIPGFGATQRLTRLLGRARAMELIFTGDIFDAARAKEMGLALEVVPADKLMEHCRGVAAKIAKKGPLAIAEAKRVMHAGADVSLEQGNELERLAFGRLFGTADQKEGMAAFLQKRTPDYHGR